MAGVVHVRIGFAFLCPQHKDAAALLLGELRNALIDVGLMLRVEVCLGQLGLVNLREELGVRALVIHPTALRVGEALAAGHIAFQFYPARVAEVPRLEFDNGAEAGFHVTRGAAGAGPHIAIGVELNLARVAHPVGQSVGNQIFCFRIKP